MFSKKWSSADEKGLKVCESCGTKSHSLAAFSVRVSHDHCGHVGYICHESRCKHVVYRNHSMNNIKELHAQTTVDNGCECGFEPSKHKRSKMERECTARRALRNHVRFPCVAMLPQIFTANDVYFNQSTDIFTPTTLKRHWAVIFELVEHFPMGDGHMDAWSIRDVRGHTGMCSVEKLAGEPTTFSFDDLKPGHTLIGLYLKRGYNDFQLALFQRDFDNVNVFKAPLKFVYEEADKLLKDADAKASGGQMSSHCFGCGCEAKKEALMRCGRCKLAKYCSKECQTSAWISGHKGVCVNADNLLRLSVMPEKVSADKYFMLRTDLEKSVFDHSFPAVRIPPYTPYKQAKCGANAEFECEACDQKSHKDNKEKEASFKSRGRVLGELTNSPKPQSPSTDAWNEAGKNEKKSKTKQPKLRKVDRDYLEKAFIERNLYEMFCLLSND